MTREELIKAIYRGITCSGYDCPPEIECKNCVENQLVEYEKQIREKAFDDVLDKLNELMLGDCPNGCKCCYEQECCPYDECNKDAIDIVERLKGE